MGNGQILFEVIKDVSILLPILGLIWKLSKVIYDVNEAKKDINGLGQKIISIEQLNNDRIDKIDRNINEINIMLVRIEEQMKVMNAQIKCGGKGV